MQKRKGCKLGEGGFTLLELLIVLAIIATLVGLSMGAFGTSSDKKNATAVMKTAQSIISALAIYKSDMGGYPQALEPLWNKSALSALEQTSWKGPYIDTPSKRTGSSPNMNMLDQNVAGVMYSYIKVTTTGGSGNCSSVSQIGTDNSGGVDHVLKVEGVPLEVAKIISSNMGAKVCNSSTTSDTVDTYFIIQEVW